MDGKLLDKSNTAAEISPYDQNLAYVPYKGTIFYRKTMKEPDLKLIPREFSENVFTLNYECIHQLRAILKTKVGDEGDLRDLSSSDGDNESKRSNTVRNSYENIRNNKIMIEDQVNPQPSRQDFAEYSGRRQDMIPTRIGDMNLERDSSRVALGIGLQAATVAEVSAEY